MSRDSLIATEWYHRAEKDRRAALALLNDGFDADTIAVLIQQAVEKYLKGYLLTQGWKLRRIHDIEELLYDAIRYETRFAAFLEFGRIVTMFYEDNRYPTGSQIEIPEDELREYLTTTDELIALITKSL